MKKSTFLFGLLLSATGVFAQTWTAGLGLLYNNPLTTKIGIGISAPTELFHLNGGALKIGNSTSATDRAINLLKFGDGNYVQIGEWEADDVLSFKANKYSFTNGNVGIGTVSPTYKLDVNGKIFLNTVDVTNDWNNSYFYWKSHSLIMGTPPGNYDHNSIDLKPGGATNGVLFSQLRMYTATNVNQQTLKIKLNTEQDCFINNNGNVGIGTTNPTAKLDVIGTIRAEEVKVCLNQGCDFVFDKEYKLMPLKDLDNFINTNKHLPEVAPAAEMESEGINLSEMNAKLLQKVEELTLYVIDLQNQINDLKK